MAYRMKFNVLAWLTSLHIIQSLLVFFCLTFHHFPLTTISESSWISYIPLNTWCSLAFVHSAYHGLPSPFTSCISQVNVGLSWSNKSLVGLFLTHSVLGIRKFCFCFCFFPLETQMVNTLGFVSNIRFLLHRFLFFFFWNNFLKNM